MAENTALMQALERLRKLRRDRGEQQVRRAAEAVHQAQQRAEQRWHEVARRSEEAASAEAQVVARIRVRPSLEDLRSVERAATRCHEAVRAAQFEHFQARQQVMVAREALVKAQREARRALVQHEKVLEWQKN